MQRDIELTITEDQAYALKKTLGIAIDNLRTKLQRYREGSKEHGIASSDFERLKQVELELLDALAGDGTTYSVD